jgi:hypothetical protein
MKALKTRFGLNNMDGTMATWVSTTTASIDFASHTEPQTLTKDTAGVWSALSWTSITPRHKSVVKVDLLAFYAAVVKTSAASVKPSLHLTKATGALAGALARFLSVSAAGTLQVAGDYTELKDFVRTGLTGVAGAGLAYLHMVEDGYTWLAHYEDCVPPKKEKRPDFVFSKPAQLGILDEYVLVEAKGTQHLTGVGITRAQDGFLKQVLPRADRMLSGSVMPTHGYATAIAFNSVKPIPPATAPLSDLAFVIAGLKFPAPSTPVRAPIAPPGSAQSASVSALNYSGFYAAAGAPSQYLLNPPPGLREFVSDSVGEVDTPDGLFSLQLVIPRLVLDQIALNRIPEPEPMERPILDWSNSETLDVRFPDRTIVRLTRKEAQLSRPKSALAASAISSVSRRRDDRRAG